MLITAAERAVRPARSQLIPTDIALAEAAAAVLAAELESPTTTTATMPANLTHDGGDPALIVLQRGLHTTAPDGAMSGHLTVFMTRGVKHRSLSGSAVLDMLERVDWLFRKGTNESVLSTPIEGGELDEFDIEVGRGYPTLPTLSDAIDVSSPPKAIAKLTADALASARDERFTHDGNGDAILVSDTRDGAKRQITIDAPIRIGFRTSRSGDPLEIQQRIRTSLVNLAGRYIATRPDRNCRPHQRRLPVRCHRTRHRRHRHHPRHVHLHQSRESRWLTSTRQPPHAPTHRTPKPKGPSPSAGRPEAKQPLHGPGSSSTGRLARLTNEGPWRVPSARAFRT